MTREQRTNYGTKASRAAKDANATASNQFASIQERRVMKKVAQPEHAYTGCVPYSPDDDLSDTLPKRRNPPILGYRGHLRHDEDRIGTTFTQGLAVATRAAEPALPLSSAKIRPLNNQPRQVHFADDKNRVPKQSGAVKAKDMSSRSGYGQFDNASGYGNFAAPPAVGAKKGMSPRSGYGAFDDASGYGVFATPPVRGNLSAGSGYGEFENASGYGAFAAPPPKGGMSPRSGYGAFDNASGYGAFAAPPAMSPRSGYGAFDNASGYGAFAAPPPGGMSPRSGYGAFDNASGYGAFAAPPGNGAISPRSGYGAFDNASGYGAFAAPPEGMSPRSGYGAFDKASGYGAFAAPPAQGGMSPRSGYGAFDNASGYGAFAPPPGGLSPRSGYGKFDDASGYGNFAAPPEPVSSSERLNEYRDRAAFGHLAGEKHMDRNHTRTFENQTQEQRRQRQLATNSDTTIKGVDAALQAKYQQAVIRVGGEQPALRLWSAAAQTVWQRYTKRTELLQAVKRSFEKHERTNHGFMTKIQLKEALRDLACVFTDDQITALFGLYDKQCTGAVAVGKLLLALTEQL